MSVDMKDYTKKAIEYFGITTDILESGYILITGEMLDFSGKKDGGESHVRYIDHREIGDILESSGTDALIEFMNMGNIRLNPESQGIDISVCPTKEQFQSLRYYINYFNGEIIVDISDNKGNNIKSFEYNKKTASTRIINDIKDYFDMIEK
jgi:hypothetical protein